MKKLITLILVFLLVFSFSACNAETPGESSSVPSKDEKNDSSDEFEPTDWFGEKILRNRKRVYELMEENPDALTSVPKPASIEPVPTQPIEGLPDCAAEWIYAYFNHRVTYEVSDLFEYTGDMGDVLRFLTAMRRVENEPVDTFEIHVPYIEYGNRNSENWMSVSVLFSCSYEVYDEEKQDYTVTDNDRLEVLFYFIKEDGEWIIEDTKDISGEHYDYAVTCMYKTMGRFPEIDAYSKYEIVDFTIYEYTNNLFDFGVIPPV